MHKHSLRSAAIAAVVWIGSVAWSDGGRTEPPGQASPPALSPAQRRAPCVELTTVEEIRSLGRKDVLVKVDNELAGSSICVWEGPPGASFIVSRQTAEWFKYEQASGPKASFDRKRQGYDSVVGTDPVTGLGIEARITRHERVPTVLVRRATDVVYVMCTDCSRDQTIALAKLAAAP
jgi:hypothetical protein